MAKIKSVSNYNGASWDTPIPLGADDVNIDITSATTDPTTDTTATAAGLIAADVVAGEGDTNATAWTKFNKFRRRVYNAFNGVAGVTIASSLVSSGGASKVYSAAYINNYMTNVVGYSGVAAPTNGTIMSQLENTWTLNENNTLIANNTNLNSIVTEGNYRGGSKTGGFTYTNCPTENAFILKVFKPTGAAGSNFKQQLLINGYGVWNNLTDFILVRGTSDNGTTWGNWRRIVWEKDLDNYVAKTGDTMTGLLTMSGGTQQNINLKSTTIERATNPSVTAYPPAIRYVDKDTNTLAIQQFAKQTTGRMLLTTIVNNSSGTQNYIYQGWDANGNAEISLSHPTTWRKALGLGTSTGAFPIQINQGGTGQTAVTATATISNIASAGTSITITSAGVSYWGKVAMLSMTVKANAAIAANTVVATLKSPYLPTRPTYILDSANGRVAIDGEGKIITTHAISSGTSIAMNATYIMAN